MILIARDFITTAKAVKFIKGFKTIEEAINLIKELGAKENKNMFLGMIDGKLRIEIQVGPNNINDDTIFSRVQDIITK